VVYRNSFDPTTFPNSNSYSGASSNISIKDFDARSLRMHVTIKFDSLTSFKRLPNFTHSFAATQTGFPTATQHSVILPVDNRIPVWDNNGKSFLANTGGLILNVGGQFGIATYESSSVQIILAGTRVQDSLLNVNILDRSSQNISIQWIHLQTQATTAPLFSLSPLSLFVGGTNGNLYQYQLNTNSLTHQTFGSNDITAITELPNGIYCSDASTLYHENVSQSLPTGASTWLLAGAVSASGNFVVAAQKNDNRILAFDTTLSKTLFDVSMNSTILSLAIGDVNGDGEKDVVVMSAKNIYAFNRNGVMLDNFPITISRDSGFVGSPILADVDGDGLTDILALTSDGSLFAWNNHAKLLTGFPVVAASPEATSMAAFKDSSGNFAVFTTTRDGNTQAVSLGNPYNAAKVFWSQQFGNSLLSSEDSTVLAPSSQQTTDFLPKARTYNWPNPVYGNSTQIRYYVTENATVNIKIFDLAGSKITELNGTAIAGMDNEVTWNVSNIQSGIYLARVEAKSAHQSSVAIIKIAVVK
ncbi:MAG TPA: FG-GAP-like repeat-containing protein, partial [Bacteroidota bacterium]|nr:FG-GAP-like repeat-containing protein [Bacteroidota bacterium]